MTKKEQIAAELQNIAAENDNILNPRDVVEFARNPETALHSQFEWNDSAAAEEYRLWQARQIIRVTVTMEAPENDPPRRVFVSMMGDRNADGGYRLLRDVLSDDDMRARLLMEAKAEMVTFRKKYAQLSELAKVFSAMEEVHAEQLEVI